MYAYNTIHTQFKPGNTVHTNKHIYTCIHVYMCNIYINVYMYMYVCLNKCIYADTYIFVRVCMCIHKHTCMIYTYI